ncbi:UDP-N-acetylmuramate dehydrogenase [Tissierella sp.]|uniref:UDP-N-acetylmuramate dehydrogenase n=1 Tax=Tissierella sp. TaxID=41274 RepID=UPI002858D518|nr:UDP-N-acetylmuramate dehydrogenase [Tissierella sp.]MDR7855824.1 UDP-N-acetylmuramate dehydrogenase [Tissierella sp.]
MNRDEVQKMFESKSFGKILFDEPMKNHTTFKIGGPVDVMIIPRDEEELTKAIIFCRENNIDFLIMGNGSNLLIKDGGIRGAVIKINEGFNNITINGTKIYCEAGALLSTVSKTALKHSLKNFEFASGIPGTIGGAITMNAGAYGGEMKDVVSKVKVMDRNNEIREYTNEEMNFRYRNSRVWDEGLIVLGVELDLEAGEYSTIEEIMKDLTYKRTSKQPLELPSGGSTFKRPEGYFAGKLIEDSGLRGLRHGGAGISEKHCGFVVNVDNATCKDVLHLISVVQKVVRDNYDVELETEIKLLGED